MPHKPVRLFTYLIGREISDLKAANWMACHNRGMKIELKPFSSLETHIYLFLEHIEIPFTRAHPTQPKYEYK